LFWKCFQQDVCIAAYGRGTLQGWNSLLVRPEPLLNKDIKVQGNKQKPNNVRPAQMMHNSSLYSSARAKADSEQSDEKMLVRQHSSKPHVTCRLSRQL